MIFQPLTGLVLELRIRSLRASILLTTGMAPSPEDVILYSRLICDECGVTLDALKRPELDGWTTNGDLTRGFTDRCRDCSAA